MKNQFWTKEEEHYLGLWYGSLPTKEIAEHLNRPLQSIYGKAAEIRIKNRSEPDKLNCIFFQQFWYYEHFNWDLGKEL